MKLLKIVILSLSLSVWASPLPAQSLQQPFNPLLQAEKSAIELARFTDSVMVSLAPRFEPYSKNLWKIYTHNAQAPWTMVTQDKTVPRLSDLTPFKCGPYWVPDPPPLFDTPYENMSWGGFIFDTLLDVIFF